MPIPLTKFPCWIGFESSERTDHRAFAKCASRISRLAELGHELRRPEADYLRDGIYELRIKVGRVNYRILYFFHGQTAAVLAHGLTKEGRVSPREIERAIARRARFLASPDKHTHVELDEGDDQ